MNKFLKTPFIPDKKINCVIIDGRTPKSIIDELRKLDLQPILMPSLSQLYDAVSGHPDMMLHPLGEEFIVVAPEVYNYFVDILQPLGFKLIKGKNVLKSNYPDNIAYNVARIDKFAIHNMHYTDYTIREWFEQMNVQLIHVKQGYAKCSTCIVSPNAIITEDKGIAKAANMHNIDVLLIEPGYISLPGLNYGFIGGATGLISKDKLVVSGVLKLHPNFRQMIEFCSTYEVEIVELGRQGVIDIGSIIPIKY